MSHEQEALDTGAVRATPPSGLIGDGEHGAFVWGVFLLGGLLAIPLVLSAVAGVPYTAALPWSFVSCAAVTGVVRRNSEFNLSRHCLASAMLAAFAIVYQYMRFDGDPSAILMQALAKGGPFWGTVLAGPGIAESCGRFGVAQARRRSIRPSSPLSTAIYASPMESRYFLAGVLLLGCLAAWPAAMSALLGGRYLRHVFSSLLCGVATVVCFHPDGKPCTRRAVAAFAVAVVCQGGGRWEWRAVDPEFWVLGLFGAMGGYLLLGSLLLLLCGKALVVLGRRIGARTAAPD